MKSEDEIIVIQATRSRVIRAQSLRFLSRYCMDTVPAEAFPLSETVCSAAQPFSSVENSLLASDAGSDTEGETAHAASCLPSELAVLPQKHPDHDHYNYMSI